MLRTDDIDVGDMIAIQNESQRVPFMFGLGNNAPIGIPMLVKAVNLPFVVVQLLVPGKHDPAVLDSRDYRLMKVSQDYVDALNGNRLQVEQPPTTSTDPTKLPSDRFRMDAKGFIVNGHCVTWDKARYVRWEMGLRIATTDGRCVREQLPLDDDAGKWLAKMINKQIKAKR